MEPTGCGAGAGRALIQVSLADLNLQSLRLVWRSYRNDDYMKPVVVMMVLAAEFSTVRLNGQSIDQLRAFLADTVADACDHTAKAFLGLTLNCAYCHDHSYEPT